MNHMQNRAKNQHGKMSCSKSCHAKTRCHVKIMSCNRTMQNPCKNHVKNHAKLCETRMRAARTLAWRLCRASGAAGWRLLCRAGSAAGRRLLCQAGAAGAKPNHSPPGPCAICAIWLLQGKPLNLHSPRVLAICAICAIWPYIAHIVQIFARTE